MKRILTSLFLLMLVGSAHAAVPASVWSQVRSSMIVNGDITVSPAGFVTGYKLDHPEKLPNVVAELLGKAIPTWTFEPAVKDGKPVAARARMHVRIVAAPVGGKRYSIRVAGTTFSPANGADTHGLHYLNRPRPPRYPLLAQRNGVSGTVYLALRINRQGHVDKAAAGEVDLMTIGNPAQMTQWRKHLADAALDAARNWTFHVPDTGKQAGKSHWNAWIPVVFRISNCGRCDRDEAVYGKWQPYIPGPRQYIPWLDRHQVATGAALPEGSIQLIGQGLHRIDKPQSRAGTG